ncbi:hypothetical protein [Hyphomicrobium nitrativorans]|nr:hypothetical protein [Hyphomicrobium nitrativorans]
MSKAIHALTTSDGHAPTRRNVLTTAAAALAALPAASAPLQAGAQCPTAAFSMEYQSYVAARIAYCSIFEIDDSGYDESAFEAHEQHIDKLGDECCRAAERVVHRTPRSWDDVAEAAHVVFSELWDCKTYEKHSSCHKLEVGLFRAILALKPFPDDRLVLLSG